MSTIELRKEVASQQYALDNCQDDMNQLGKIKEARKEDWYYVLGDDEQHYKPKYEKFKGIFFFDN